MDLRKNQPFKKGFTLVELLVTVGILSIVMVGLMQLYIYCENLSELARNQTIAVSAAKSKIEEMRNYDFDLLTTDYASGGTPGDTFNLTQISGTGLISMNSIAAELLEVTVSISWQSRYGHTVSVGITSLISDR